jgi:hypothetical protein
MATHGTALVPKITIDTDLSLVTSGSELHVSFVIILLFAHRIHRIDRYTLQTYMKSLSPWDPGSLALAVIVPFP